MDTEKERYKLILIALADRLDIQIPPKSFGDIFDEVARLKAKEESEDGH